MIRLPRLFVFGVIGILFPILLFTPAPAGSFKNLVGNPEVLGKHNGGQPISIAGVGEWAAEVRGIKPRTYYLLSFRVKREGWRDGEYPYVKLFGREIFLDELFSWGAWRRASYLVNSGNHDRSVLKFFGRGLSDAITFDDVGLREFQIVPLSPRGDEVEGPVEFKWAIPEDDRIFRVVLELARNREFRNKKTMVSFSPMGNSLRLENPLQPGKWYWRLSVHHNRIRLASSNAASFAVSASADGAGLTTEMPRESHSGEGQSFAHNNPARFFPIGIYSAAIDAFAELKEAGFNLVQSYNANPDFVRRFVKAAGVHGLKVLSSLTMTRPDKNLSKFIAEIKDERGLFGWYIADEPEGRGTSPSFLWLWSRYIQSIDPGHPTALVNIRSRKVVDYAPAVDIAMVDPYPIPHMPVTWLSDSIDEARRAIDDKKPVWAVIQVFNWSDESRRLKKELAQGRGRFPTYEEERCLTYLSIVHGVRGLMFFSHASARRNDPELKNWKNVKRLASELRDLYPLLLAPDLTERLSLKVGGARDANGNPAIHY
ncbi:MAG: hypothetical protein ACE5GQ_07315, partial [Nitrospinales bacterium]